MIKEKPHDNNWNFFLALEKTLEEISRYIEFTEGNFPTYSIELARLLLAAGSEFDVIAKQLCKLINPKSTAGNIIEYYKEITPRFEKMTNEVVYVPRYDLNFQPLMNWKENSSPNWWRSYNNVKHERNNCYSEASLQNTLNALGALYVLLFYYYAENFLKNNPRMQINDVFRKLQPETTLLRLEEEYYPKVLGLRRGKLLSDFLDV
jgi:hypothetical protein